jgi:hypothetical protein
MGDSIARLKLYSSVRSAGRANQNPHGADARYGQGVDSPAATAFGDHGHDPDDGALWAAVDRAIDAMGLADILAHELGPLAARRWRRTGRDLPAPLREEERAARFAPKLAAPVLARAREAYDGRLLVLKGPEIAALYPPGGRLFRDFDLLADDAPAAQAALERNGFAPSPRRAPDPSDHHLPALALGGIDLRVEIHTRPNWPRHLQRPPVDEIFARAVPSRVGIDGLEAPAPAHHTLLMAGHAWKDLPLANARDVVDIAALAATADQDQLAEIARRWGLGRLWVSTTRTIAWLVDGSPAPSANRLWGRHLIELREATVFERHKARAFAPFSMFPPGRAAVVAIREVLRDLSRTPGETRRATVRRTMRAASNAGKSRSGV